MSARYERSQALLARALSLIPLGSQTFSKSPVQFPLGISPHFATRANGARLIDADGNEYRDFINALAAVLLGYGDEEMNAAVRAQLDSGVTFSLSHELEMEVAERIVDMVPCAEQVRFGKNGTDATSAAVRLARAYSGRDRIAICGYHGWQDWSIATTTRDLGIPAAVKELSHSFPYNDLDALEQLLRRRPGEFAAVIMEPLGPALPAPGFLEGVRALTERDGALLIFDEIVTGFRVHSGGAQALTGVTPDLATLGKGMANGFPLSAVVGRREHMALMEEIFFSATFAGETLSLAAAKVVLDRIRTDQVPQRLAKLGERLSTGMTALIEERGLTELFSLTGHPAWSFLRIADAGANTDFEIKTLLLQELFARGFLFLGSHNLSAAHEESDIDALLGAYEEILPWIGVLVEQGTLRETLKSDPLEPLFRVR